MLWIRTRLFCKVIGGKKHDILAAATKRSLSVSDSGNASVLIAMFSSFLWRLLIIASSTPTLIFLIDNKIGGEESHFSYFLLYFQWWNSDQHLNKCKNNYLVTDYIFIDFTIQKAKYIQYFDQKGPYRFSRLNILF